MMKNNKFETIFDAYQLVEGAHIRAKQNPEEIFKLATYQADKRGYLAYPIDHGIKYEDFGVLISESELIHDYEIGSLALAQSADRKVA
jgi:hypothetical protein